MLFVILQAAAGGGLLGNPILIMFYMMVIFLIYNFFFVMPKQKKKEKEQLDYIAELAKGSKVVTIGGVHGKVNQNKETTMMIEVAPGINIEVEKVSISYEMTQKLNEVASK
jgi:preprotein translocase subunit YajC